MRTRRTAILAFSPEDFQALFILPSAVWTADALSFSTIRLLAYCCAFLPPPPRWLHTVVSLFLLLRAPRTLGKGPSPCSPSLCLPPRPRLFHCFLYMRLSFSVMYSFGSVLFSLSTPASFSHSRAYHVSPSRGFRFTLIFFPLTF